MSSSPRRRRVVRVIENLRPHFHGEVRSYAEEHPVERGAVEFAEGHAVVDERLPALAARPDAGGTEQTPHLQTAHGALRPIRVEDSLPEEGFADLLRLRQAGPVGREPRCFLRRREGCVDAEPELVVPGIVVNDEDGPHCEVPTLHDAEEVNERHPLPHGLAKTRVVAMVGIGPEVRP